jgi:hypothetical protein
MDGDRAAREAAWRAYTFGPALREWKARQEAFKAFRRGLHIAEPQDDETESSKPE